MSGEDRRCKRCSDEEFRIDGYCTIYCRDMHEVEQERDEALAEVARLRRGIEAYRTAHGCDDKEGWGPAEGCVSCEWEREDRKRIDECGDDAP